MATTQTLFTDHNWVELGTTLTNAIVQGIGNNVQVHIGSTLPAASAPGFDLTSNAPVNLPGLDTLGGGLWARSLKGNGGVRYATA